MLAYIDPAGREQHQNAMLTLLSALIAGASPEVQTICIQFAGEIAHNDFYRALGTARALIAADADAAPAQAA